MALIDVLFGKALAGALRTRTGQAWELVTGEDQIPSWGLYIAGPDGMKLHVEDGLGERVLVAGVYPQTRKTPARITCSAAMARGVTAIAADIARKVLPEYREELYAVEDYEAAQRADWDGRVAAVHEAEKLFGAETEFPAYSPEPGAMRQPEATVRLPLRGAYPHGKYGIDEFARVTANREGDLMSLDLKDVPAPVVLRMLKILADYTKTIPPSAGAPVEGREPRPFSPEFERLYDQWLFSGDWQRISWEDWLSSRRTR